MLPASPPAILTGKPNVWSLLAAFRRRWLLAICLGLLVGGVAGVVAWYWAVAYSYTAVSVVRVDSQKPKIAFDLLDGRNDFSTYQRGQAAYIKSRAVLFPVLEEPEVAQLQEVKEQGDAAQWLESQVAVDFTMGPELLRISMSGKDQRTVNTIVQAIQKVYLRQVFQAETEQRTARLKELDLAYREILGKLDLQRAKLTGIANENQLPLRDPKVIARTVELALEAQSALEEELRKIQMEIDRLKRIAPISETPQVVGLATGTIGIGGIQGAKALELTPVPPAMVEERLRKDSVVDGFQKDIARLEVTLAEYKKKSPNPSLEPGYRRAQADLDATRNALAARCADAKPRIESQCREELLQELWHKQALHEQDVARRQDLEAFIAKQLKAKADLIANLRKGADNAEFAHEDLALVLTMRAKINAEIEALKVELHAPSRVTAWTEKPVVIKREGMAFKAAPLAGLLGFLLAALGIALLEFRARRVNEAAEISSGLHLPVVGALPLVQSRAGEGLTKRGHSANIRQQILIESVDSARTMLLHEFRRKNLRTVMVASAGAGEGKTVLSAHLSASLARAGWRVLLVDGDLRRPSLHKVFGFEPGAGLAEALRDDINIRGAIQPGPAPGLWVVPAGLADTLSLRALAQGKLTTLFDEIRDEFDFIILDSAPVLPVADAQLMAQSVDGVILSVLQNVSRLPLVYAAFERLALLQANVIGAVIHGSAAGPFDSKYTYLALPASQTETSKKAE